MSYNITEIKDFYSLVYVMEQRVKRLLIDNCSKQQTDAEPEWSVEIIEDEILPALEKFLKVWDSTPC